MAWIGHASPRNTPTHVYTGWMEDAACADTTDVDWFDIDCGLEAAITICHTCAVRADCLNYAVSHNIIEGIWAGYWGEGLATQVRTRRQGGGG